MIGPYAKYIGLQEKLFFDPFPRNNVLQPIWSVTSGAFEAIYGGLRVLSPGELVYNGIELDANMGIGTHFVCTDDLKVEIRARRSDAQNFVGFDLDFETQTISISQTVAGVKTVLKSQSHLLSQDPIFYSMMLVVHESDLLGFINGSYIIDATSTHNQEESGFSLLVPEMWEEILIQFNDITCCKVVAYPSSPTIPDDPTDIAQQFRKSIKERIESPPDLSFESFRQARIAWERGRDYGKTNQQWSVLGYPVYEPMTEEWFKKP
jgi:hypothetical protein